MSLLSTRLLAIFSLAAFFAGGCSAPAKELGNQSTHPLAGSRDVRIDVVNIAFSPATLEIEAGTTVVWINKDERVRHTATSGLPGDVGVPGVSEAVPPDPDGLFDGDLPDVGADFSFTFDGSGSYEYFCRVHPSMTGVVTVT